MVLGGMSNMEQMEDNLSYMKEFEPLDESEKKIVSQAVEAIKSRASIPCTVCRYCVDGCPQKIAIPDYFKIYNDLEKIGEGYLWLAKYSYSQAIQTSGKASACIKCKKCESHCPQHIGITGWMEKLAERLES